MIKICQNPFDAFQEIQEFQAAKAPAKGKCGAASIFIGTMRDFNDGELIEAMHLAYYPGMTEKQLGLIIAEATERWHVNDVLVVHRVGDIRPDDTIVLVSVWSSHRGDAFDACRFIMEALKSTAPFWKKEVLASGQSRWVEHNTDGYWQG